MEKCWRIESSYSQYWSFSVNENEIFILEHFFILKFSWTIEILLSFNSYLFLEYAWKMNKHYIYATGIMKPFSYREAKYFFQSVQYIGYYFIPTQIREEKSISSNF